MSHEDPTSGAESRFHAVQPLRDLESNWGVDLAKNLEDYLLKICSGEFNAAADATTSHDSHLSVNFAEAALLLQGSIQVYSRKVEYLYNLVLHALEFVSQKRINKEAHLPNPKKAAQGLLRMKKMICFGDVTIYKDRPSTKVHAAPGGGSSLGYLFGGAGSTN